MRIQNRNYYDQSWAGSKWVTFTADSILPRNAACYVIYLDGILSYVGQTTDLAKRMSSHKIKLGYSSIVHTIWGSYKNVTIKARFSDKMGDWAMREIRLINKLCPPYNVAGSTNKKKK